MTAAEAPDIVLVEDNDDDAELAMRALRKHGFTQRLKRLADGAEALDFFFQSATAPSPRVVLLDLKLPKVDGMQVLKELKANEGTRRFPVVMLSSSKQDRDLEEAYRLGVNSYVVKPVEFDEFLRTVEQLGAYWMQLNQNS